MTHRARWMLAFLCAAGFAAAHAADPAKDPELVVWQGPVEIDFVDIDGRLSRVPADKRAGFMNDPDRIEQLLRGMLLTKTLAREAEAQGLHQDPVVAAEIALARDEVLAKRVLSMQLRDIKVPDMSALAEERYISSPNLYRSVETIDVRNILIASKTHGEDKARELATEVRRRILAGELDFVEAAKQYNEDGSSKDEAGLIAGLTKGTTLADFEAAAFALENPGDVSELVKTKFGFHIIRLEKKQPSVRYPFEQVRGQIVEELRNEFIARSRQTFLDQRRSLELDAVPERVQALRTRYAPGGPGAIAIERTQGKVQVAPPDGDAEDGSAND